MSTRYIAIVNSSTKEQANAFLDFLKLNNLSWWHWLENSWLIVDRKNNFSASKIRDKLNESHPGIHKLVVELSTRGDSWAGFGPSSTKRNMFKWIEDTWKD